MWYLLEQELGWEKKMNRAQVEKLLKIIKSFYPYFSITEDVIENWSSKLKDYEFNEVLEEFDNYVNSGDKEPPTISILIHPLKTLSQKESANVQGLHVCSLCNKKFKSMEEADKCYERDLDLRYIKKMSGKLGFNPSEIFGDLRVVTLETINEKYPSFIKKIVSEEKQKHLLTQKEKDGINLYWKYVIVGEK
jgi:hypothetical protein